MAELLVKAVDSDLTADPIKNDRGVYKAGDIIDIVEDGYSWSEDATHGPAGTKTRPQLRDIAYIVKAPELGNDLPTLKEKYLVPEYSLTEVDRRGLPLITKKRACTFSKDLIPDEQKGNVHSVMLTKAEFESCTSIKRDIK